MLSKSGRELDAFVAAAARQRRRFWIYRRKAKAGTTQMERQAVRVTHLVEELAALLRQQKSLGEKIDETRGRLDCIKKKISETLVQRYLDQGNATVEEDLMKAEQTYERLMQALLDMKKNFEQQMRSLDEQIVEANVIHLRQVFEEKRNMLVDCLNGVDQKVLGCFVHLEEYKRIHGDLNELGERLRSLGVDSLEIPQALGSNELIEVLGERVQHLRSQGRL